MFPRDHWCNCIQQYELGNLERCAEIVMQAQYAVERNIGSNSDETFNQHGAAQCRECVGRAHGAPSRQTSLQSSRRNRTRSAIFLWQNPGASLQRAFCKSLFVCGRPHTVALPAWASM